jgi:hypothetical protein
VGILTESDFIRRVTRNTDMKNALSEDFMNRDIVTCDPFITAPYGAMLTLSEKAHRLLSSEKENALA